MFVKPLSQSWCLELTEFQKTEPLFYFDIMEGDPDNPGKFRPAKLRRTFEEVAGGVGPGWGAVLEDCFRKLFRLGWDGRIEQIKEKFGTLRLYLGNNLRDETLQRIFDDVTERAEDSSGQFCERCGSYGKRRNGGWILTLCAPCALEQKYPLEKYELEEFVAAGKLTQAEADGWKMIGAGVENA